MPAHSNTNLRTKSKNLQRHLGSNAQSRASSHGPPAVGELLLCSPFATPPLPCSPQLQPRTRWRWMSPGRPLPPVTTPSTTRWEMVTFTSPSRGRSRGQGQVLRPQVQEVEDRWCPLGCPRQCGHRNRRSRAGCCSLRCTCQPRPPADRPHPCFAHLVEQQDGLDERSHAGAQPT